MNTDPPVDEELSPGVDVAVRIAQDHHHRAVVDLYVAAVILTLYWIYSV